jgi:hypothetical protein
MAKGQQHGNREAKKPKKEKPKVIAAAPGNAWVKVDKTQGGQATQGKKK